ncbi:MAG: O-antigen ligase family protein [Desulfobulbaceae bacterium]|nr:MAG: O-antigen ligase family protein [Desulfobulbaceae bacterium]
MNLSRMKDHVEVGGADRFRQLGLYLILVGYPFYVFFNAYNGLYSHIIIVLFLMLLLPRVIASRNELVTEFPFLLLLWSYGSIAFVSIWFPASNYYDYWGFMDSFSYLVIGAIGVWCIGLLGTSEIKIIKIILSITTLWLSTSVVLDSYGIVDKQCYQWLSFGRIVFYKSNINYYSFWLLFSMWGTIALLWQQSKWQTLISIICYCLTCWALLKTSSVTPQVALFISTLVFLLSLIPLSRGRYQIYLIAASLMIVIPVVWVTIAPLRFEGELTFFNRFPIIASYLYLFDFSATIIRDSPVFGYGYGATMNIPISVDNPQSWLRFPGGHSHNIVFLLLIEYGLFGLLYCICFLLLLFDYVFQKVIGFAGAPAVWALFVSGQVIFSLSFSVWRPDVVLCYCMFFIMLIIAVGPSKREWVTRMRSLLEPGVVVLTISATLFYIAD